MPAPPVLRVAVAVTAASPVREPPAVGEVRQTVAVYDPPVGPLVVHSPAVADGAGRARAAPASADRTATVAERLRNLSATEPLTPPTVGPNGGPRIGRTAEPAPRLCRCVR